MKISKNMVFVTGIAFYKFKDHWDSILISTLTLYLATEW